MNPPPFDIEEHVSRHGAALRQLAIQLVGASAADDAVQETWIGAMRQPPRDHRSHGGWLATLLRNVVADMRRSTRRRSRREQIVAMARAPHSEDHAVVAMRAEMAMRLLRAVQDLDSPYREAIWQRFFEDKAPRVIARQHGVPVATVKSWLKRGSRMLRERLGGGDGGSDWRSAFAMAFGFGKQASAAASVVGIGIVGGVVMATWMKVTAAAAVAATAVSLWWQHAAEVPPLAMTQVAVGAGAQVSEPEPGLAREAAVTLPDPRREATPIAASDAAAMATIRGRCVDDQGRPLTDCIAELNGFRATEARMAEWLRAHAQPAWSKPATVTTRDDGVFTFRFAPPPPFAFTLKVHSERHGGMSASWQQLVEGAVVDLGDLTMRAGARLVGRVVDGDGHAVPDTLVVANRIDERQLAPRVDGELRPGSAAAHSDERGELVFEPRLVAGSYAIESKGAPLLAPLVLDVTEGQDLPPVVLVVDRPEQTTIRGRVLDDIGQPVAAASVTGRPVPRGVFWSTSTDGSFELSMPRREATAPIDVVVDCEGYDGEAVARAVEWGRDDVVLTLQRAAQLELRVVDAQGLPVEDYAVILLSRTRMRSTDGRVRARGPFPGGVATIAGVEKGQWLAVVAFPAGSGRPDTSAPFVVEGAGVVRVTATVHALGERSARVVDATGEPVAGAELVLCEPLDDRLDETTLLVTVSTHARVGGPPKALIVATASSDAAGHATLRGPVGKPLGLVLPGGVHVPTFLRDVRLDEPAMLVVTVPRGVRLRGRVQPPSALAALPQLCGIPEGRGFGEDGRPLLVLQSASGRTVPNHTEMFGSGRGPGRMRDDGTFDVAGLRPERYAMFLFYRPAEGGLEQVAIGNVDLTSGEDREVELDLSPLIPGTLAGSLSVNGAPAVLRKVRVEGPAARTFETDGSGRFEVKVPAGTYRVLAPLTAVEATVWVTLAEALTVRQGEVTTLPLSVQSGRVRVRLRDAQGRPAAAASMVARLGGATEWTRLPRTTADGTLEVELPLSTVTFAIEDVPAPGRPLLPAADLGTATIRAGQTTTLELQLPAGQGK
jgi:RNA polymerase sigma-70 factor (ECF subfamily)